MKPSSVDLDRLIFQRVCEDATSIPSAAPTSPGALGAARTPGGGAVDPDRRESGQYAGRLQRRALWACGAPSHFVDDCVVRRPLARRFHRSSCRGRIPVPLQHTLPIEILGRSYERFLGSTIRRPGETSPRSRKSADGVASSTRPSTLSPTLSTVPWRPFSTAKRRNRCAASRILDPACGREPS